MPYNLTDAQKDLLREIVRVVRSGKLDEEFMVVWPLSGASIVGLEDTGPDIEREMSKPKLMALYKAGLIDIDEREHNTNVALTGAAFEACDNNFDAPDTSFMTQLTPLADVSHLDSELKKRVLPILGAGAADPTMWDSGVRTASVVLEERLRDVGQIVDSSLVGKTLVNNVFGDKGTLAGKFSEDSERQSYRDLYSGVVGLVRNPSAHRLIDPNPSEGGVLIVLVDLLLSKLEALR